MKTYPAFSDLLGKTLREVTGLEIGEDRVTFVCTDGSEYILYHSQDCCESVSIEDVTGNVADLLGTPLTMADEVNDGAVPKDFNESDYESCTWTFYKLATVKGYVDIRWLGASNGYYSESVEFEQTQAPT